MAGIATTIVILGAMGFSIADRLSQLSEAKASIKHTNDVINSAHAVLEDLSNAETGQRGFVITGQQRYLEPYSAALASVNISVTQLRQLSRNSPDQSNRVAALANVIATKFSELKETIDLRRASGFEPARQVILSDRGKQEMDGIRRLVTQILDSENKDLIKHTVEQDLATKFTLLELFVICVVILIMQIIMGLIIRNFVIRQKLAEQALRESHDRYEQLLSGIKDYAIYMLDPQGKVMTWNTPAQKIKGYAADEIIGKHFSCFYSEEEQAQGKPAQELEIALKSGRYEEEGPRRRKDGSQFWANVIIRPIYDGSGQLMGFAKVVRDITERKEVERRVSEFYSMISHELRTPLTSIRGTLSLMEGGLLGTLSQQGQQLTHTAHSEADRLSRLINDILDIRKIEAGMLKPRIKELLPSEIVAASIQSMERAANQASIKLISQVNTSDRILGDRDRIIQVLTNLISNAIKFSPAGAEVLVQVENVTADIVRLSVIDKGAGIPKWQTDKLFVEFQQLDSSDARPKEGTGLGLAISKAIVEQHSGRIGVKSAVGEGSTFWFELPCQKAVLIINKTPDLGYKILLVEDDCDLRAWLGEMLAGEGFGVDEVGSLKEAEKYLAAEPSVDVILLDILLPDGNGLNLLHKLRQSAKTENIPVIVLSGRDPSLGMYAHPLLIDWVRKPVDQQRLLGALKLAVRVRAPGRARVLVIEDDQPTRALIRQVLTALDVEYFEAADGTDAINLARSEEPDLIILDLAVGLPDEFGVVEILRREKSQSVPLLVYTARDLNEDDKQRLTLGLTAHLTKSRTSEKEFLRTIKNLLDGLVKSHDQQSIPDKATAEHGSPSSL